MHISELKEPLPKKVIVDGDWMIYRVGFASEDDDVEFAKARLTELLTDVIYFDLKADDYELYLTGKENFRYSIAVTVPYKGNRDKTKRPKHYSELREHAKRLGAVVVEGEEADDKVAQRMSQGLFVLVGVDKDLLQIPGWIYNPVKKEIVFVTEFEGLRHFYTQILTGDRTDTIPGLHGVGPKKAAKALEGCTTEEELYRATLEAYRSKGKDEVYLLEQAQLLWLRRTEGEVWTPPI